MESSQRKQLLSCMATNVFNSKSVHCTGWLAQSNMHVMQVAAGASYIPVTAFFSTEIQPMQKLRKNLLLANNQRKMLSMLLKVIFLLKSLATWVSIEKSYFPWMCVVIWLTIYFSSGSTVSTLRLIWFGWVTVERIKLLSTQNLPKYKMCWSRSSKIYTAATMYLFF